MSCDILLRKRVFARLASSAFFRAISNLSLSFCVSFAASFAAASAFLAFHKSTRIMPMMTSGRMEIDENYGMIEDIWQTLFEIFDDEAKKKNIALHYTINVEHEHILTDATKEKKYLLIF